MARMKMYLSSYDGDKVVSVITDLFLENDADFKVYQMLKNHHYFFERDTPSGICFELFFNNLKKGTDNKPIIVPPVQLLQILRVATPVVINPNYPSFDHYRTKKTIGVVGLDPILIFLKNTVNQLVPGVYIENSDCILRSSIYFKNKENNDELTVKTLGQGKYTYIIAQLVNIKLS